MLLALVEGAYFFFNDTATTEIYTLSLHDALPISEPALTGWAKQQGFVLQAADCSRARSEEHTSELQSHHDLVCRLLLEKKNNDCSCKLSTHNKTRLDYMGYTFYDPGRRHRLRSGNDLPWPPSSAPRRIALFFFNDTATTEIYTLSLHDALPISRAPDAGIRGAVERQPVDRSRAR